jgi:hypothetical protein
MSGKDFLNKMLSAGEEHSASVEFTNVARMKISFGYSGYLKGHRPSEFFKPYGNPEDAKRVAAEVSERLAAAGSKRKAVIGALLNIPADTNTSGLVTWDIEQVAMIDNRETSEWKIFVNSLEEGDFPINEWFWGSYKNVETGTYQNAAGEPKKRYLSVPVEVFANEADAIAAAGSSAAVVVTSKWSEVARANYTELSALDNLAGEILEWLEKAKNGIPYANQPDNYPLPKPLTPPAATKYIAELYSIAPADIDLMAQNEVPF